MFLPRAGSSAHNSPMADNDEFVPDEDFAEVDISESLHEDEPATEEEYDTEDEAPADVSARFLK